MLTKKTPQIPILLLLLLLSATLTACWSKDKAADQPPPDGVNNGAVAQTLFLPLYYVKLTDDAAYLVRETHPAPGNNVNYEAALKELIKSEPQTEGALRVLPEDTEILALTVQDGVLTVDFSAAVLTANVGGLEEWLGIMSIVNTLTEFTGIEKVSFLVEGAVDERTMNWWGHVGLYDQPFQRDLSQVGEPLIWVNQPTPGQVTVTPLIISGSAMVFEGTVCFRLSDSHGNEIANGFTTAIASATEWESKRGNFAVSLGSPPTDGTGELEVFWKDAADGQEKDVVRIPVTVNEP